ncbi:MAG: hypothetical protein RSF40_09325 [Oscillospiraceae bacterium]
MKKSIVFIICIAIIMTACSKKTNRVDKESSDISIPQNKYINGTYSAQWGDYIDGWKEFVDLSIENDKITILRYDAKDKDGVLLSTVTEFDKEMEDNNLSFNLHVIKNSEKFQKIIDLYNSSDKNVSSMECVAGATKSSNRFKLLVKNILDKNAKSGSTNITDVAFYGDGIYTVEESKFNSGWKDFVELTVTDGVPKITRYDSYNNDNKLKSEDADTKTRMISYSKSKNRGEICPEVYIDELINKFSECQNKPDEIENVVGATASSEIFKVLVDKALNNSAIRGKTFDSIGKYKDGTYYAEMKEYEDGWKDFVKLEIKDDIVRIKEFNSKDLLGNLKSDNKEQKIAMMNGNALNNLPEIYPEKYINDIISSFSQSNSDVLEMENISGATLSSNNFKLMVGEILRTSAINGEPAEIKVETYR